MYTATTKHISSPKRRGSEIKRLFYGNKAFIKRDVTYLLNEDEKEDVKVDIELLKPKKSWRKNKKEIPDIIGEMNVMFNGKTIASVPIYYENERNKKPKKSFFETFQSVFQKAAGGSSWSI